MLYLKKTLILFVVSTVLLANSTAQAEKDPAQMAERVGIDQKHGSMIPLDLKFVDDTGTQVQLGDIVRPPLPTIIVPVYYQCPRLCGFLLNGVTNLMNELDLKLGKDFNLVTVSFDPSEGTPLAAERAATYRSKIKEKQNNVSAWRFLTGDANNTTELMKQIGFKYQQEDKDFSHGAVIVLLTPNGEISQYFFGVEFSSFDLRLALVEASKGSIGTVLDQVLLFCFRFDHMKGQYIWAVVALLRVVGIVTLLAFGALMVYLWRNGKRRSRGKSQTSFSV